MNHGVRKFWILLVMYFEDLYGTLEFHLFPCFAWKLEGAGLLLTFPMQFALFYLFLQFGLISFDKGGN